MPSSFPSRDLTLQYESQSYQNLIQEYAPGGGDPNEYFLNGLGNVILSVPIASVGQSILTSDQVVPSASYSLFSEFSDSSSYALASTFSDSASLSTYSNFAGTASYAYTSSYELTLEISSSWASASISASYAETASISVSSSYAETASFPLVNVVYITSASYATLNPPTSNILYFVDRKDNNMTLTGHGTPVGSTTPQSLNQLYIDEDGPNYWLSNGLTNADWAAIGEECFIQVQNSTPDFGGDITMGDNPNLISINFPTMESVGSMIQISSCVNLITVSASVLSTIGYELNINSCPLLSSLTFPSFISCSGNINIFNCSGLTYFSTPNWVPIDGTSINLSGNALDASSIELILRRCVLAGVTTCTIDLSGGTNAGVASLTAQGQADVTTLGGQLTINS